MYDMRYGIQAIRLVPQRVPMPKHQWLHEYLGKHTREATVKTIAGLEVSSGLVDFYYAKGDKVC